MRDKIRAHQCASSSQSSHNDPIDDSLRAVLRVPDVDDAAAFQKALFRDVCVPGLLTDPVAYFDVLDERLYEAPRILLANPMVGEMSQQQKYLDLLFSLCTHYDEKCRAFAIPIFRRYFLPFTDLPETAHCEHPALLDVDVPANSV
jgi:hypothetical protein